MIKIVGLVRVVEHSAEGKKEVGRKSHRNGRCRETFETGVFF
jgi:hypothetical protein